MPITAFIGVRISWLIVARNALFASLAPSAAARASFASWNSCALRIATPTPAAMVLSRCSSCRGEVALLLRALHADHARWPCRAR